MQDGLGGFFPASNYIDLGLFEHVGEATATQKAPVKFGSPGGWDVMGYLMAVFLAGYLVSLFLFGWFVWWLILVDW